MTNVDMFLKLLRASLRGKRFNWQGRSWTHEQYMSVMAIARQQAVAGLVAQSLVDSGVKLDQNDALKLFPMVQRIRQNNTKLNEKVVDLCKQMNERNIRIYVFKGQTLATMYPDGGLRQSGDVDFGCYPEDWDECLGIFKNEMVLDITDDTTEKHVSFNISGVEYELHRQLTAFSYPRHRKYWAKAVMPEILNTLSSVNINGYEVPTLHPTYNALYVFVHIFYHLLDEGVGLRQFCDWAVLLMQDMENSSQCIDVELLERHLRGLGLKKAYTGLGAILTDFLGLPEEIFPLPISAKDHKRAKALLNNMLEMGNFGHNKRYKKNSGAVHGLQHIGRITMQARRFYVYAPSEALWRVPYMFNWWASKLVSKFKKK